MTSKAPVVTGVVASAGGLAALKSMCSELDQLVGASMIVTQHVSPTHHSQLPELLSACTECAAEAAKSGVEPQAGTIYGCTPGPRRRDAVGRHPPQEPRSGDQRASRPESGFCFPWPPRARAAASQ